MVIETRSVESQTAEPEILSDQRHRQELPPLEEDSQEERISPDDEPCDGEEFCDAEEAVGAAEESTLRRSDRESRTPVWMRSGDFSLVSMCPSSYREAMQSDEKNRWLEAFQEELDSIRENETWDPVERPKNAKVIQNRWVLRIKKTSSGERYRARLVAKGFQQSGHDFDETFSPVARYTTVRVLIAIAAAQGLCLRQFDVKSAFLYGVLREEVFLEQPEGFSDGSGPVCKLKKGLYGLR